VGLVPSRLNNPDFAWEKSKKMEFGLELGFVNDRLLLTTSYYDNRSSNQLVGYPISPTTGFASVQGNFPAKVKNWGIEFDLITRNVETSKFTWRTTLNFTIPKNTLLSFPNIDLFPGYSNTLVVGEPLTIRKLFQNTGVNPAQGVYEFEDYNKDGILDILDWQSVKFIGQKFYGGLTNNLTLNRFQINFIFQFVKQSGYNYLSGIPSLPGSLGNQPEYVLERWQKSGDVKNIQRFNQDFSLYDPYSRAQRSDLIVGDASFVRLRNCAISYLVGKRSMQETGVMNLRLFIQAQNLFTISKYRGLNPENQSITTLPPLRVVTGGINLTF
jgi:outer membrane receptor protein involved in Fe transport